MHVSVSCQHFKNVNLFIKFSPLPYYNKCLPPTINLVEVEKRFSYINYCHSLTNLSVYMIEGDRTKHFITKQLCNNQLRSLDNINILQLQYCEPIFSEIMHVR